MPAGAVPADYGLHPFGGGRGRGRGRCRSCCKTKSVGMFRPIFCHGSTNLPVTSIHKVPNRQTVIINITARRNLCWGVITKNFPEDLRCFGAAREGEAAGISSGKNSTDSLKSEDLDASLRSPSNMGVFYHSAGRRWISPNCTVTILSFDNRRKFPSGVSPITRPSSGIP